jgi:hypothetical protein
MNYHDHLVNIGIGTENAKLNLTKAGQKGIFSIYYLLLCK